MTFLIDATDRAYAWFGILKSRGIDLTTNAHLKVRAEATEFAETPTLEEAADVYISLIGALYQRNWSMQDLALAVDSKMAVNERRKWFQMLDGTYQHTEE